MLYMFMLWKGTKIYLVMVKNMQLREQIAKNYIKLHTKKCTFGMF